jgi:DNA-binding transcriptional ArsR family regulator
MRATLLEDNEKGKLAFDALVVSKPEALSVLGSKLAMNIIKELAESPACALDVARRLKVHEQKVYYHVRRLEKAGLIYSISSEKRHGMIAKIFNVVAPVIATKIFDKGIEIKNENFSIPDPRGNFLQHFIQNGKLDGFIVIGDTVTHGRFDIAAFDVPFALDFFTMLGQFLKEAPSYRVDILLKDKDLQENLILIGNNKTNAIIDKINDKLPIYFDPSGRERIFSKISNKVYEDPRIGVILKQPNPFNEDKSILLIGGIARRGMLAASMAIVKHFEELTLNVKNYDTFALVVQGIDKDGDGIIDSIKILE